MESPFDSEPNVLGDFYGAEYGKRPRAYVIIVTQTISLTIPVNECNGDVTPTIQTDRVASMSSRSASPEREHRAPVQGF